MPDSVDDDERHLMEFQHSMEEGGSASASDLNHDASREEKPPVTDKRTVKARKEAQDLAWRPLVFWGVLIVVAVTLVASLGLMIAYAIIKKGDMDPTVLAAWFGSAVIQVIGLLAIVTRSLFPNNGHSDGH